MTGYLHPGVYIEEIPSGSKPIEGVATSVAAFVGPTKRGKTEEAVAIHSWEDYLNHFGGIQAEDDWMGLAISAFYLNGGKDAYVARMASVDPPSAAASINVAGGGSTGTVFKIEGESVGDWANDYRIRLKKDNTDPLKFNLEIGRLDPQREFRADEVFNGLDMEPHSDNYLLTRVNGGSKLVKAILLDKGDPTSGSTAYTRAQIVGGDVSTADFKTSVKKEMKLSLNLNRLGAKTVTLGPLTSPQGDNAKDGKALADLITAKVQALGHDRAYGEFKCNYDDGKHFTLVPGGNVGDSSVVIYDGAKDDTDLAQLLKLDAAGQPTLTISSQAVLPQEIVGSDGRGERFTTPGVCAPPGASDYQRFFTTKLVKLRDVSILVLPGKNVGNAKTVVEHAISHCEATRNRVLIMDPPNVELADGNAVDALALSTSTYAVLYYPWIEVANPFYDPDRNPNAKKTIQIAPSALMAGMWSKIDGRRGVWKAPAGVETSLLGVAALRYKVGDGEQNTLNPLGVNCIRSLPGYGPVVWGARTRSTKADPEWRYVPVRRTAIMIEESIYNGIQWAVFEPNDHRLWSSLRVNIDSFLNGLWRAGAFQGEKAADAYFVRCNLGDTMTQGDIDAGQVIVVVGFAPLKPAEFVIVRIQQKVAQQ